MRTSTSAISTFNSGSGFPLQALYASLSCLTTSSPFPEFFSCFIASSYIVVKKIKKIKKLKIKNCAQLDMLIFSSSSVGIQDGLDRFGDKLKRGIYFLYLNIN